MPRTEHTHIVAVDILPIRPFPGHKHNITTLVGDITTAKCKADITNTLRKVSSQAAYDGKSGSNHHTVDLVLHDGAPNVGASYDKDAYEQNEIAVHALKCATQHLKAGGHFVTKVYRSRDYASYLWVCQQLFDHVTAFKPKASRVQSAEIFLVCQNYKAPDKIDPRMLDPKHIFEQVEGDSTGGKLGDSSAGGIHVFHKAWDQKRRQREGYDMAHLDASMRHIEPVSNFIEASGMKEAIQVLSTCTGFTFTCEKCQDKSRTADQGKGCNCQFYLKHPLTTPETKDCVSDLKVLNKSDFKALLIWRTKMQEALQATADMKDEDKDSDSDESEEGGENDRRATGAEEDGDSDKEEEQIQSEIEQLRRKQMREKKRQNKKERAQAAKRRKQAALGMDLNAIDIPEHDKIFSLATITSKGALEAAAEVNLDKVTLEDVFGDPDDDDIVVDLDESLKKDEKEEKDEDTGYSFRLDAELDEAYDRYLAKTKDGLAKSGTKMEKRKKKSKRINAIEEAEEDEALLLKAEQTMSKDAKAYAELLQGPKDSDDEDESSDEDADNEDDDGFNAEPMTPEEFAAARRGKKEDEDRNPLIHKLADEPASAKTARWFSNPLFASIGEKAESAAMPSKSSAEGSKKKRKAEEDAAIDSESESESDHEADDEADSKGQKKKAAKGLKGLDAEEVLKMMPKIDKQIRHEKRLKALAREERKKERRAKRLGEAEAVFEIAPGDDDDASEEEEDDKLAHLNETQKKKVLEARELIKAGMGMSADDGVLGNKGIEIVSELDAQRPLPVMDERKYDSEHEDYDSDDLAETLALGTMMLRKSKAKALVDASYNRYAWNDPEGLPDWFVDDEAKHYRPQLPIPPALIAKIKQRQMALSEKPIKKVAEARARKSKRAKLKLAAAKKKAEAVANSTEMSEAMKLKAISKALQQQDAKKPSKTYVVAKKGRGSVGAKGVKLVDKRMKSDKRAMERAQKKRKKGKQGGLVGSKKRRHHK
jgi:AdoMet-dependent rRNA methyltransferase SPB1